MDSNGSYGIVKNAEDWVRLGTGEGGEYRHQCSGQLGPMGSAYGTGDTAMAHVGGDTNKVKGMGTLCSEYGLTRAVACTVVERLQAYCARGLLGKAT